MKKNTENLLNYYSFSVREWKIHSMLLWISEGSYLLEQCCYLYQCMTNFELFLIFMVATNPVHRFIVRFTSTFCQIFLYCNPYSPIETLCTCTCMKHTEKILVEISCQMWYRTCWLLYVNCVFVYFLLFFLFSREKKIKLSKTSHFCPYIIL